MAHTDFQSYPESYYAAVSRMLPPFPKLAQARSADICIIGGGLAGLSAALPLAEQGREIVLIDAGRIGGGASGSNIGQAVNNYASGMAEIEKQVNAEQALWFWQQSLEAVELVDCRVKQYSIDCDWRRGHATAAIRPDQLGSLLEWQDRAAKHYGYPDYEVWNQKQLRQNLAGERYLGALYDPHSGHLNPLAYTLGLAAAAIEQGMQVYENTRFTDIRRLQKGFIVSTPEADIRCSQVILAINTGIDTLRSAALCRADKKIMPVHTLNIATASLGETAQTLIRNQMAVCDNRYFSDAFSLSSDGRLLFGSKTAHRPKSREDLVKTVRNNMLRVFPQLEKASVDYAWRGRCDFTLNRAPHFSQLKSGVYCMQGFSGHGLALSGVAGLAVAESIQGHPARLQQFERILHNDIPAGRLFRRPYALFRRLKDLI